MRLVSLEPRAGGADCLDITTEIEFMEAEQTFRLDLNGDLVRGMTVVNIIAILLPRVRLFADNVVTDYSVFGIPFVRLYFRGTPARFNNIDNMIRSLNYYIGKYFTRYDLNIVVEYKEDHTDGK